MAEAVCEDPLYLRKWYSTVSPKLAMTSSDQLNMKFMARIQVPWEFAYVFSVQVYYISHGECSIYSIPPSTSFSPSHPPRTQSNSQWSSLETNSGRKTQWSCSSWFCSTWETANLRYVLWLALPQCFCCSACCYVIVILIVFEWLLIWFLCKWKVLPSEISKYLFEMLQCLVQVTEKIHVSDVFITPCWAIDTKHINVAKWLYCLSVCLSVRLPFCVCLSVSDALRTGSSCFACAA